MDNNRADEELTVVLDALAKAATDLQDLLPALSLRQLELLAQSCPWDRHGASVLLDLDTWAAVAATSVRDLADGMTG